MPYTPFQMKQLRDNLQCFVCGPNNPAGLKVHFEIDRIGRIISGRFTPATHHQGYEGIVHGGILAALLDEAMVKLAFGLGLDAVSAELIVKFRVPASPGDELIIKAGLTNERGRLIEAEAKIESNGMVIAEGRGKLLRLSARG